MGICLLGKEFNWKYIFTHIIYPSYFSFPTTPPSTIHTTYFLSKSTHFPSLIRKQTAFYGVIKIIQNSNKTSRKKDSKRRYALWDPIKTQNMDL